MIGMIYVQLRFMISDGNVMKMWEKLKLKFDWMETSAVLNPETDLQPNYSLVDLIYKLIIYCSPADDSCFFFYCSFIRFLPTANDY